MSTYKDVKVKKAKEATIKPDGNKGLVICKIGKKEKVVKNLALFNALNEFVSKKEVLDFINKELVLLKREIADFAKEYLDDKKASTLLMICDDRKVKASFPLELEIIKPEMLRKILGERYDDLVEERVNFKPSSRLKELALKDDGLRECCNIKDKAPIIGIVK